MRIYLDNCCFNRPYDNQSNLRIELETKAKLFIQGLILQKRLELVWSYILDYENSKNIHMQKRLAIQKWRRLACIDIIETPDVIRISNQIQSKGLKSADAIHIACSICAYSDLFITTDDRILKYHDDRVEIINPISFLQIWEDYKNE